jgi:pyruvate kinase
MKNSIYCTLGPSSLKKDFLKFVSNKKSVSLLRLNLSHIEHQNLSNIIKFVKKYTSKPICIDTEGAQIRTRLLGKKFFINKNKTFKIYFKNKKISLYPPYIQKKLKVKDILDIGFENLKLKINKINKNFILLKCISPGYFETNKGVHLINRKIKMNTLTEKDLKCIEVAKKFNISHFALSFTNSLEDIKNFSLLLNGKKKIFKIETQKAIKNFKYFIRKENLFLIDRGDLSKDISIENIPKAQRYLFNYIKNRKNIKIAVATNLLESMITQPYPTRAEANDIFNSLEMGCSALVLAAETAVGKYPMECINFADKMLKSFKKK